MKSGGTLYLSGYLFCNINIQIHAELKNKFICMHPEVTYSPSYVKVKCDVKA